MAELTILDGAMGTMIQSAGLKLGERPEIFALSHPEIVENIQRQYVQAGSHVIYANTFGANRHKMEGTGHSVEEVVKANVAIAKRAATGENGEKLAIVGMDFGPTGELMAPLGTMSFDDAYETYKEQAVFGEQAGAEVAALETFTDLYEVRAAVLAVKENTNLPIWVTMSFEQNGRTFTGTTVECMAATLEALDVDAMGINCSLGPKEIFPLIERMRLWTTKPIIVKPNAGLPDPSTGKYFIGPKDFAQDMKAFLDIGVYMVGGCCGTSPAFIAELAKLGEASEISSEEAEISRPKRRFGVCSASTMAEFNKINIVGERLNPTGKKALKKALLEHDMNTVMQLAIAQADAGADILDINVGVPGVDEPALMKEVVLAVQSVCQLPLQIDSSNVQAIETGLRYTNGKAIVNSVNANAEKLKEILPIAKKYGAAVIGLTMDKGLPSNAQQRIEYARTIMEAALSYGIPKEDLIIDCLTLTISAQQDQAMETLKAIRAVKNELGLHNTLGVSNIAFGLPEKSHITQSFLTLALHEGLDFPIVNPNSDGIMDTVITFKALANQDSHCEAYIERFAAQALEKKALEKQKAQSEQSSQSAQSSQSSQSAQSAQREQSAQLSTDSKAELSRAILKGLGQETEKITAAILETTDEMTVINDYLIPALDIVGEKYEKQEIFLPQLINAANSACKGFDLIKRRLAKKSDASISKGKIIIATVEGDIHDIGKNIVKIVLENYGYNVIDLGKDVPVQTVVDRTIEEDAHLVALSALMTTTVSSMKRTIEALKASGHPCKTMVGGAVLTQDYAMEIGADYYTKDPKQSADVAKKVLG